MSIDLGNKLQYTYQGKSGSVIHKSLQIKHVYLYVHARRYRTTCTFMSTSLCEWECCLVAISSTCVILDLCNSGSNFVMNLKTILFGICNFLNFLFLLKSKYCSENKNFL